MPDVSNGLAFILDCKKVKEGLGQENFRIVLRFAH